MENVISNWIVSDLSHEKLTDQNYDVWSRKVQFLLEDQELLEPINHNMEPPPSPEDNTDMVQYQKELEGYNAWKKKSRAARMILLISMQSDLMLRFDCHQTAKDVWDAVKDSFDRSPLVRMRQLQLCFASYKMKANHTISEHIAAMSDMIDELTAAGYVLTDEQQVQAMIRSIPDDQSWDLIKQKIICDVNIQTFEDVSRCLMLEGEKLDFKKPLIEAGEVRLECSPDLLMTGSAKKRTRAQVNQSGCNDHKKTEPFVGKTKKSKKERLLCFCCRRSGHLAKDCSITCYNCQQRGHGYKDCPEREVLTPTNAKAANISEVYIGWTKPEKGWVKVNTDGAVQESQVLAASGGVIRDDNGYWLTGFVQNMDPCSIQMAKLWGVLHGLQLAWDRGFRRVIIEMDCENCCALLGQDVLPNHALHNLLRQCQDYLRRDWTVQYRHVYREANRLAGYVCSLAFTFPVGFHALNEPPAGSVPFVFDDMKGVLTPP